MLNQRQLQIDETLDGSDAPARAFQNPLSGFDIMAAAQRQMWVFAGSVAVMLVLGVLYVMQAIPTYSSSVSILIDAKKVGMTATNALEGSMTFDSGAVDSQLQILQSDKLAASVATRLGLQNNMAFLDREGSLVRETIS